MGTLLFKRVDYKLDNLIMDIESGKLGLPDIQRPFVWPNSKVRDLLDSMMKGYPIGYLLLWDAPSSNESSTQIGSAQHAHESPKQLIIDGQQRLTSLFAVMKGIPVRDYKFQERRISIAFNPLERKFDVTTIVHKRSPDWIEDVSAVFSNANSSFIFINTFIANLEAAKMKEGFELSNDEKQKVAANIADLLQLKDYLIPTLDINDQADEEAVADIFVRVNASGKSLNENDFILTLISVYDDRVRNRVEEFCQQATVPVMSGTSYNQVIKPKPSHIIRTVMAYGFNRARLRYAYMLLRGKDFEKGTYNESLRISAFEEFKAKLSDVLNLNNWHSFINCVISAGYLSDNIIASENAIVYAYVMYLTAKYKFKVDPSKIRGAIARWFYMTAVTAYYSTSTETTVQADLNNIKELKKADDFLSYIDTTIESKFTSDYFAITLPNELATSAAISPSWYAYCAAQNVLNAKALFSTMHTRDLFTPGASGTKSAVEKHHLFPKAYLKSIGITEDREINQIANFTFIEWQKNIHISNSKPSVYWAEETANFNQADIDAMCISHALPQNWVNLDYPNFLTQRRKLMSTIIKLGYESL